MRKIRVLVVEDSLMFRDLLVKNLNADPGIEVIATAKDPFEARDAIIEYKPDVMTLDVELPRMNGIEFLQKLQKKRLLPVGDPQKTGAPSALCGRGSVLLYLTSMQYM